MGLLDDAIREHLELKRRHGADEDEIQRKASEAFGPVRRAPAGEASEPAPPLEQGPEPFGPAPEPVAAAPEYEPPADDEPAAPAPPFGEPAAGAPPAFDVEPPTTSLGPPPGGGPDHRRVEHDAELERLGGEGFGEPDAHRDAPPPAPGAGAPPADAPPARVGGDPAVGPPATRRDDSLWLSDDDEPPAADPAEADPAAEDVLEETPEFLQDTPEHDRLWFEQRPPRDFDFDG